ncbi:unnamed protein product [Sphenostylis stenocarpa]|uniref:Uncharacterized protein n=1 Tax=Sphenostylis stenocarpa TaxID=92480 RepID=A0AA87BD39_9FABA|nr:unnamed protein product [Sphenostylis stenocarpa]
MTGKVGAGGIRKEVAPLSSAEKKETAPGLAVDKEKENEKKGEGEEVGEKNDVVSQEECLENPHRFPHGVAFVSNSSSMEGGFVEEGDMKQWKEMHLALPPSFLYGDGKEGASLIFDIGMEIEQLSNLNRPCACSSIQRLVL